MTDEPASVRSRLQNPTYTGENRCIPCTVVNLVLAAAASVLVGFYAPELGILVFVGASVVIYVRGYLVPGTPMLTERFLPDRVLAWFDTEPDRPTADDFTFETIEKIQYEREHGVDSEQFLQDAGVVEVESSDERRLSDSFAALVEEQMAPYRESGVDTLTLVALFDTPPEEIERLDREYPAASVGRRIRKWPSEAALQADAASHDALVELTDEWAAVPLEQRMDMLESIRSLYRTCPSCGGSVEFDESIVQSCCRSYEVVSHRCSACGSHLAEMDPEVVETGAGYTGIIP